MASSAIAFFGSRLMGEADYRRELTGKRRHLAQRALKGAYQFVGARL